jgi:hypothetical protein
MPLAHRRLPGVSASHAPRWAWAYPVAAKGGLRATTRQPGRWPGRRELWLRVNLSDMPDGHASFTGRRVRAWLTHSTRCPAVRVSGLVAVVLALLGIAAPAAVGSSALPPPRAYFGMHYSAVGRGHSWPDAPIGLVRLWDTGTTWTDVQPARDQWEFSVLDRAVANARAHHAQIALVLGQTPIWASSSPTGIGNYNGQGVTAPPTSVKDWWIYVHAVANRYRGRIAAYEIWNEVNLPDYFSGSIAAMVRLSRIGRDAVKRADPSALVLSPSVTLRGGTTYLKAFARAGGYRYSDVVNIHGYPVPDGGPEAGVAMIDRARRAISSYPGGQNPIWNTEMNFGLPTRASGGTATSLSLDRQAAYVVRAYLLNWSHGVQRLAWYDWNDWPFEGVQMSTGGPRAAPPGQAFGTVVNWMRGRVEPCAVGLDGVYRCTIRYGAHRMGSVRWIPSGTRITTAPQGTFLRRDVFGGTTPTGSRARLRIGYSPVLFEYRT